MRRVERQVELIVLCMWGLPNANSRDLYLCWSVHQGIFSVWLPKIMVWTNWAPVIFKFLVNHLDSY